MIKNMNVSATGVTHYTNEHGQYHREDGPAVIWPDRKIAWWLNGRKFLNLDDWLKAVPSLSEKKKALLLIKYRG